MRREDDPRLVQARARSILSVADRLGITADLKRFGREYVGPCPAPGCGGTDRFSFNTERNVFNCRVCQGRGDPVALVRHVLGVGFAEALTWLEGEAERRLSPAEQAEQRAEADRQAAARRSRADRARAKATRSAIAIWDRAEPAQGSPVHAYLARRGITRESLPVLPQDLRFAPHLPYFVERDGKFIKVHEGPAMLAAIRMPNGTRDGKITAVHRTWFDLTKPKGAARIEDAGDVLDRKKSLGSKQGGAIRLITPPGFTTLVIGEGIETVLTAHCVGAFPGAAFWSGVDLGNLSGPMLRVAGRRWSGVPDMGADVRAFRIPPWLRRLVLIKDGDSDPGMTTAKLASCARRARAVVPDIEVLLVDPGPGRDLNDLLMEEMPPGDGPVDTSDPV